MRQKTNLKVLFLISGLLLTASYIYLRRSQNANLHPYSSITFKERLISLIADAYDWDSLFKHTNKTQKELQGQPYINLTSSSTSKYSLDYFHHWLTPQSSNHSQRIKQKKAFEPIISLQERFMAYDILRLFDKIMTLNNLTYFLYSGTLLGSYRHHDIVPWDDDFDVIMPLTQREALRKLFKSFAPRYILKETLSHDKLYRNDSMKTCRYSWKWPYLDISFYKENSTFLWDFARPYGVSIHHPKSIVFPLHRRPLYNLYLNAPKDSFAALVWTFGFTNKCKENGYSHIIEGGVHGARVNCSQLSDRYPFVERYALENGIMEVLMYKGERITSYVLSEPNYSVSKMFEINLIEGYKIPDSVLLP